MSFIFNELKVEIKDNRLVIIANPPIIVMNRKNADIFIKKLKVLIKTMKYE